MEEAITNIYHFLFETFYGVTILVGAAIVISIIACAIMEHKSRKALREKQEALAAQEEAEWDFDNYDDDDDEEDDEDESED